jgi:hypothetical protein
MVNVSVTKVVQKGYVLITAGMLWFKANDIHQPS